MDVKDLQKLIDNKYTEIFGYTPLSERLSDLESETNELVRWTDIKNLQEETSDLLGSIFKLCCENEWSVEDLIKQNIEKIESRAQQYKSLGRKYVIALLGGAFDPITSGHIQLAQFVLNTSKTFDEVWLLPANKHMYNKEMVSSEHRINMINLAIQKDKRIRLFNYEIENNLSGETYNFVKRLKCEKELNEKYKFSIIIGQDNANSFDKWVNYSELEKLMRFVIVPRKGIQPDPTVDWYLNGHHIYFKNENTNIMEVSSTFVRDLIKKIHNNEIDESEIYKYLDENVYQYIKNNNLYL